MPPPRPFFDPANTLTDEEIATLGPGEVHAACDQIDQHISTVLQQIDENFAQANLVLNQRILPAVQKYGENSQQIWESVKVSLMLLVGDGS
jgi:hypothetical protein